MSSGHTPTLGGAQPASLEADDTREMRTQVCRMRDDSGAD